MIDATLACPTEVAAEHTLELVPLSMLGAGQSGRIGGLFGPAEQVHRLRELGLRDGAVVQMVRPGRTCIIRLDGQKLGFRGDEATGVLVHTGPQGRRVRWGA